MPIQKFAPMTKNFPTFDCDAHVTEPPWLWERAKDWLTKDEYEALKNTIWYDPESISLSSMARPARESARSVSVDRPEWLTCCRSPAPASSTISSARSTFAI